MKQMILTAISVQGSLSVHGTQGFQANVFETLGLALGKLGNLIQQNQRES